jgi:hypothetical protein
MDPLQLVGAIGGNGQPKEPVYQLGNVERRGRNFPNGKNLADYIDDTLNTLTLFCTLTVGSVMFKLYSLTI